MSWKAIDRYSSDYKELQEKNGVKFYKTPDAGDLGRHRRQALGPEPVL
jgi:hypothetical protein